MMTTYSTHLRRWLWVSGSVLGGFAICALMLLALRGPVLSVQAAPLPGGVPKLSLSTKTVTPTVAAVGGATLTYTLELINTGAITATATTLTDVLPAATTYVSGSVQTSGGTALVQNGVLTWTGDVGFDSSVTIELSVDVSPMFTGTLTNTAVISQALISTPISVSAETVVTDVPLLSIAKASAPAVPGPNKTLLYTLTVANQGQDAVNLPITVTDQVPVSTTLATVGDDGVAQGTTITWTRSVTLALAETTEFTFSVLIDDVVSGTVIANTDYGVDGPAGLITGTVYTVTVVDPIFSLVKHTDPDPPGSNREMTYTLTLFNAGSLATDLVITDRVPAGATYVRGGAFASGVVSWTWPSLNTDEAVEFTFTVAISDVAGFPLLNNHYRVCSAEGVCQPGRPVTSPVTGPVFEAVAYLNPIAKKPGGGGGPVTPTLVVRNLGPGNAIAARAHLYFENISVSAGDLTSSAGGSFTAFTCPITTSSCSAYAWVGSFTVGQVVTFSTNGGQNTIGGSEGNRYTTTVVITDALGSYVTPPVTGTTSGKVTHLANLLPTKSAPTVVGRGELLTYSLTIWNSGLSTDLPPVLTDVVPVSTTFVSASDGGVTLSVGGRTVVSWTLPLMGPGDYQFRSITELVANALVSATQIINDQYSAFGYGNIVTGAVLSGPPVTTTVQEVGLIDSFKEVTPTWALPGEGNVLTYVMHVVNSSALSLTGVTVSDTLPWQTSTYQRDAVASAGQLISDIVSVNWLGDVGPFSEQWITFTVLVDPNFEGPITNTAVISHPTLLSPVNAQAVAYITDDPVLFISKSATPDPVRSGAELEYTLHVSNVGVQATDLVITDVLPAGTQYVSGTATAGGQLVGNQIRWTFPVLAQNDGIEVSFRVQVGGFGNVVNSQYAVASAEGIIAFGPPVTTTVTFYRLYLPLVRR
jgi:uncharacterized repeat protein (TIGR01451 family)